MKSRLKHKKKKIESNASADTNSGVSTQEESTINDLAEEVLYHIFSYLKNDLKNASEVSRAWRRIIKILKEDQKILDKEAARLTLEFPPLEVEKKNKKVEERGVIQTINIKKHLLIRIGFTFLRKRRKQKPLLVSLV